MATRGLLYTHRQMTRLLDGAYNPFMPRPKQEDEYKDDTGREKSDDGESAEKPKTDELSSDETKRFERSDNLRRRSEWFQKRTSGG